MMNSTHRTLNKQILWLIAAILLVSSSVQAQQKSPKNIILMISDGCGYNHIKATNYYYGQNTRQVYENFPVIYGVSTYSATTETVEHVMANKKPALNMLRTAYNSGNAWTDFCYLSRNYTGSAAAATAMACGKKSARYAIGVDMFGKPMKNIAEKAFELGKASGVVTSVPLSHATPSGFAVHNISRKNYEEIARDMVLQSRLNVIMGCGNPDYDKNGKKYEGEAKDELFSYVGGAEFWKELTGKQSSSFSVADTKGNKTVQDIDGDKKADAWTVIQDRKDFQHYANIKKLPANFRLLGIPKVHETLQQKRGSTSGDNYLTAEGGKEPAFTVPFIESVPSLPEMTNAALNVLDNDPDGFFLMVEGGAIDWASHANQPGRMIEEESDFNAAVESVVEWVENNSSWDETLVIVTADHECGYLTGPNYKVGADLTTTYAVEYVGEKKMPGMTFNSHGHTNQLVPLFAKGAGAEMFKYYADEWDYVHGYYLTNSEIGQLMFLLWQK